MHFANADAFAQQLLDRIVVRVSGTTVTLTDLQIARAVGVVSGATDEAAVQAMVDRQLLLVEVNRFPPPDPPASAVAAQAMRLRETAGPGLPAVMAATGSDDARITDMARDSLRIDSYIEQRFGTGVQVTDDEAAAYYGTHPEEFRRNGGVIPFEEALPVARERANAERRRQQVERWLIDLRGRADIVFPEGAPKTP